MMISVDIGGTSTRIASSNSLDSINLANKTSWTNTHDFETDYKRLTDEIRKVGSRIEAMGIGIPGDISKDKKTVYSTSWNQEWENKPFVDMLAKEFDCSVFMDNDALVASLGVAYYGEGKNKEFAYVTWGTGIGGALVKIINEKSEANKLDWYEHFEDWEEKCGGRKLEKRFNKMANKLGEEEWQSVMGDFYQELMKFSEKVKQDLIIFGGGISSKQIDRLKSLKEKDKLPEINISTLGEDTGLFGGFGLIQSRLD